MRVRVAGLSYRYPNGSDALRDVSFAMEAPELLTVVGPNGSGKSTLLKLLARILEPTSGTIEVGARALREWPAREFAKTIGYLAQNIELPFPMRAIDVVLSGRAAYVSRFRWESEADIAAASDALSKCDAAGLAQRSVNEMSGGEKKRVFLARVLSADPHLILLDEPLASLDIAHARDLAAIMRAEVARGRSIIFVAHDFNWAAAVSDRVAVMSRGRLVGLGPPRDVLTPALLRDVFDIETEILEGRRGVGWIVPALTPPSEK